MAGHLIEQLVYDPIDERYDADIFTAAEIGQDFSRATERLKNHVFDYCITDSGVERDFVGELDTSAPVEVYAKRSEEHTSELQSLMRSSYAVFCLKKKIHEKHKS